MTATTEAGARAGDRAAPGPAVESAFDAYAVTTRSGPHVTMQAGVVHAGRYWTTTSVSSLKTKSIRRHGHAAAVIPAGAGLRRIVAGRTSALRPWRPLSVLGDPLAPLRSGIAVARLGLEQLQQLVGYLEAAADVPADWLPHRRALLVTRIDRSLVLDGDQVVEVDGAWRRRPPTALGEIDRSSGGGNLPVGQLPETHGSLVDPAAAAGVHVGLVGADGPVAVPARWLGDDTFAVPAAALVTIGVRVPGPAVAVFDESRSRRPDEKLGAMFRGRAALADVDGPSALLRLHTDRITTWDGFTSGTVTVA